MSRIFRPFAIGPFCILPADEPPPAGALPLLLGRQGAFGSGEHETTAACLELLASLPPLAGCDVLDLGSGTGILAIAAARRGAGRVLAVDLEWPAAISCAENVALNGVGHQVFSVCSELAAAAGPFQLVLANIYADILMPLAADLVARTRPGGWLLLSGIPLQEKFDIYRRYTGLGCVVLDSRIGEDFASYLLQRPA